MPDRGALVIVPTFREAGNIGPVIRGVREAVPDAVVWVVDDDSGDGTADEARDAGAEVRIRRGPRGLGHAYREAYLQAAAHGASIIYQLDGDGTHDPGDLPRLGAALAAGADLAIGSRSNCGLTPGWNRHRRALSRAAAWWSCRWLSLDVRDPTSGMRAWRGATLRAVLPATLRARGYAVQVETLARAVRGGARVIEVPILPRPRGHGRSKLDLAIGWEALWRIPTWR